MADWHMLRYKVVAFICFSVAKLRSHQNASLVAKSRNRARTIEKLQARCLAG